MLKNPKGSLFQFFGIVRLFSKFFSLFSPKGPPFNFFDILQQIGCLKRPKGPPFQFVGNVRLFFRTLVFLQRVLPSTATKMLTISEVSRIGFSIFEYCKLTLGRPFATFESWIWRRLVQVPAYCSI